MTESSKLLKGLNEGQAKAVQSVEGTLQINAVAGSGKTRVLTHRIAYMVNELGIKPGSIMCTTFTKKATEEMKERLGKLISKLAMEQITIGTTHSIGYRILAKEYANMNHHLAPAFRKKILINFEHKKFTEQIKKSIISDRTVPFSVKEFVRDIPLPQFIKVISGSKMYGDDHNAFTQMNTGKGPKMEAYTEFFTRYEETKWLEQKVDADDLLYLLVKLFKEEKSILEKYQKLYDYILVDEAQDNNYQQYELIKMLGKPNNNIFIVGDDDQCQPVGETVLTTEGYKNIEDLNPFTDRLVSYDKRAGNVLGFRDGYKFDITSRDFEGNLRIVKAGGKEVKCTPNHKWIVKWDKEKAQSYYAVYLMEKKGNFRVGWCKLFKSTGENNVTIRSRNQKADKTWILRVYDSEKEASMWESIVSTNYGITQVPFIQPASTKYYTQEVLDCIFDNLYLQDYRALHCLKEHNLEYDYPIYDSSVMWKNRGGSTINEVHACNLISDCMTIPVHISGKEVQWSKISVDTQEYSGKVYSLDVNVHELYLTNGLVTHNSMYGFRGAKPEEFIYLNKNYPDLTRIDLEHNYRSSPSILDTANKLIAHNTERLVKKMIANKEDASDCVFYEEYDDELEEGEKIVANVVTEHENNNVQYDDMAVLYRTNAQSRAIEDALIIEGIPYVIHGGISFYERKEIKDLVSYLKLAVDPNDNNSFKRVINTPSRYLGKAFIAKLSAVKTSHYEALDIIDMKPYEKRGSSNFRELVEELGAMYKDGETPNTLVEHIMTSGYKDYLLDDGDDEEEGSSRFENIDTLKYVLSRYDNLLDFLKYVDMMTSQAKHTVKGVQLMTIHKSKGLEFPVVFVAGATEGLLPHGRALDSDDGKDKPKAVEEERRLMYVAVTRAESKCYVSAINSFNGKFLRPSRFTQEMGIMPLVGENIEE